MRAAVHRLLLALSLAGALGAPALAQRIDPQTQLNILDSQVRASQAMTNRQAVIQQNQLSVLDSQLRTEQSLGDIRSQSYTPTIPPPPAGAAPPMIDTSQLATIPDDKLAASNARVRAAAEGR
jgi:hypothetical protein